MEGLGAGAVAVVATAAVADDGCAWAAVLVVDVEAGGSVVVLVLVGASDVLIVGAAGTLDGPQ